ncbi:3-hydroxyacyl-CoA dehydrogenase NAD-binding domain-containing protein [Bordetella sp. 2513F-2]
MNVKLNIRDGVALIEINNPPVNALSTEVLQALLAHVEQANTDPACQAIVITGADRHFSCGADITEFGQPGAADLYRPTMTLIESSRKPVVAAIHGLALGGGLELALACQGRVASGNASMGLPEVKLGILPGAGGTQRLPRLIGAQAAFDLIVNGKQINASAALQRGLVDKITDGDVLAVATAYALELVGNPSRRTGAMSVRGSIDAQSAQDAINPNYPARQAIVKCVEAASKLPFEDGLDLEHRMFEQCLESNTSKALRHIFFAEREAAKLPSLPSNIRPIKKIAVIGAGTMGRGIVINFLNANLDSILLETSSEALNAGVEQIRRIYDAQVQKGRLTADQAASHLARLKPTLNEQDLADCDLVIEAVFENMDIKLAVCRKLGAILRPGCILASNTSTLDIDVLAQASGRPADFLGMHFFSPANIMRLLEVVRGKDTSDEVLATVMRLAKIIRKTAVVSGVCYGFIGNRMLESYLREADFLLMEGASPRQIDSAIEALGLAMGPCRMLDMAGIDVAAKIVIEAGKSGLLPNDPAYRAVVGQLFEAGRNGQKSGCGYYRYQGRDAIDDPEALKLFESLATEHRIERRGNIGNDEIIERCLYPLINEGARILEEGIAYRAGDIDVVWTSGYGFPDFRGGPMFMADHIGAAHIVARLEHYASARGNAHGYWAVSPLLARSAESGKPLARFRGA